MAYIATLCVHLRECVRERLAYFGIFEKARLFARTRAWVLACAWPAREGIFAHSSLECQLLTIRGSQQVPEPLQMQRRHGQGQRRHVCPLRVWLGRLGCANQCSCWNMRHVPRQRNVQRVTQPLQHRTDPNIGNMLPRSCRRGSTSDTRHRIMQHAMQRQVHHATCTMQLATAPSNIQWATCSALRCMGAASLAMHCCSATSLAENCSCSAASSVRHWPSCTRPHLVRERR